MVLGQKHANWRLACKHHETQSFYLVLVSRSGLQFERRAARHGRSFNPASSLQAETRKRGGGDLLLRQTEEILYQRKAPGNGQQENLFDNTGAAFDSVVNLVRLDLLRSHNRSNVLRKIDATLFASAALALFVFAGRTFEPQRGVATSTKSRNLARVDAALRTFDHALCDGRCVKRRPDPATRSAR
jgi:hypothetical protein